MMKGVIEGSETDINSDKNSGSFAFAISLIVVCYTGLDRIHSYFENNVISDRTNLVILIVFTCILIVSLLYIGLYLFFKAMSLETKDCNKKERLENIATNFYLNSFRFFIVFIIMILFVIVYALTIDWISDTSAKILLMWISFISFYYILRLESTVFKTLIIRLYKKFSALCIKLFKHDFLEPRIKLRLIKYSELNNYISNKWSKLRKKHLTFLFIFLPVSLLFLIFSLLFFCILILVIPLRVFYILYIIDSSSFLLSVVLYALPFYALVIFISKIKVLKPIDLSEVLEYIHVIIYIGIVVTLILLPYIFSGHLVAEMNSIYYKQDKQIPLDISVTGFRDNSDGVFLELYRSGSKVPLDSINIQSNSSITDEFLGKSNNTYLCGNSLGIGRYKVFINSSSLTEGDYYVSIICGKYSDTSSNNYWENLTDRLHKNESINHSFYLVDTNRT